jgi:predicted Rossmann fold nucleotide-binding protein DprA/Smf involved in DNA uptake
VSLSQANRKERDSVERSASSPPYIKSGATSSISSQVNAKSRDSIERSASSPLYIRSGADTSSISSQVNTKGHDSVERSVSSPPYIKSGADTSSISSQTHIKNKAILEPTVALAEPISLSTEYQQLLDAIDFAATPVDRLVEQSGLTASVVSSMLLHLELQGFVSVVPGGYMRNKA